MHTPLCGHAQGLPEEYVRQAARAGLRTVTFTCHIPMRDPAFGGKRIRMPLAKLGTYRDEVQRAAQAGRALGVEVLRGIEAEYFPEEAALEEMDQVLRDYEWDFVLGSLHHQLPVYREWLVKQGLRDDEAIVDTYFRHLARAAASGRYDSMSHPDVIRSYGTVASFEPERHEGVIRAFLEAARAAGVCIELNTSGLIKEAYEIHPDPVILAWARETGCGVTVGSDAHRPEQVGQHFDIAHEHLTRIGFEEVYCFRGRKAEALPLEEQPART